MVILSQNPYETNIKDLNQIKVKQLYLNGKEYTSAIQNPFTQIIKGMKA